jgi:hypothetical protein
LSANCVSGSPRYNAILGGFNVNNSESVTVQVMRQFEKQGSVQTLARRMPAADLRVFEQIFPAENIDYQCLGTYRIRANFKHLSNFEFLNSVLIFFLP